MSDKTEQNEQQQLGTCSAVSEPHSKSSCWAYHVANWYPLPPPADPVETAEFENREAEAVEILADALHRDPGSDDMDLIVLCRRAHDCITKLLAEQDAPSEPDKQRAAELLGCFRRNVAFVDENPNDTKAWQELCGLLRQMGVPV